MRYPTRKAIESLIKGLNLPELTPYCQDWEYEVSNPKRIAEFIEYYENTIVDEDEKFTLMVIIISSCNDALEEDEGLDKKLWEKIKCLLIKDRAIHKNTIDYWAIDGLELEDCFYITPLIRSLKTEFY